jgi:hypothetical protein
MGMVREVRRQGAPGMGDTAGVVGRVEAQVQGRRWGRLVRLLWRRIVLGGIEIKEKRTVGCEGMWKLVFK